MTRAIVHVDVRSSQRSPSNDTSVFLSAFRRVAMEGNDYSRTAKPAPSQCPDCNDNGYFLSLFTRVLCTTCNGKGVV